MNNYSVGWKEDIGEQTPEEEFRKQARNCLDQIEGTINGATSKLKDILKDPTLQTNRQELDELRAILQEQIAAQRGITETYLHNLYVHQQTGIDFYQSGGEYTAQAERRRLIDNIYTAEEGSTDRTFELAYQNFVTFDYIEALETQAVAALALINVMGSVAQIIDNHPEDKEGIYIAIEDLLIEQRMQAYKTKTAEPQKYESPRRGDNGRTNSYTFLPLDRHRYLATIRDARILTTIPNFLASIFIPDTQRQWREMLEYINKYTEIERNEWGERHAQPIYPEYKYLVPLEFSATPLANDNLHLEIRLSDGKLINAVVHITSYVRDVSVGNKQAIQDKILAYAQTVRRDNENIISRAREVYTDPTATVQSMQIRLPKLKYPDLSRMDYRLYPLGVEGALIPIYRTESKVILDISEDFFDINTVQIYREGYSAEDLDNESLIMQRNKTPAIDLNDNGTYTIVMRTRDNRPVAIRLSKKNDYVVVALNDEEQIQQYFHYISMAGLENHYRTPLTLEEEDRLIEVIKEANSGRPMNNSEIVNCVKLVKKFLGIKNVVGSPRLSALQELITSGYRSLGQRQQVEGTVLLEAGDNSEFVYVDGIRLKRVSTVDSESREENKEENSEDIQKVVKLAEMLRYAIVDTRYMTSYGQRLTFENALDIIDLLDFEDELFEMTLDEFYDALFDGQREVMIKIKRLNIQIPLLKHTRDYREGKVKFLREFREAWDVLRWVLNKTKTDEARETSRAAIIPSTIRPVEDQKRDFSRLELSEGNVTNSEGEISNPLRLSR